MTEILDTVTAVLAVIGLGAFVVILVVMAVVTVGAILEAWRDRDE